MNNRGQIGQIITSFPSLIYIFVIMFFFMIISGFMSSDLNSIEYTSPVSPSEKKEIEQFFPDKNVVGETPISNVARETLINEFLNSEIIVVDKGRNKIVTVQQAIEQMCRVGDGPFFRTNIAPVFETKFSSLGVFGKFAIVRKVGVKPNFMYQVYSSNVGFEINEIGVSQNKFNEFFPAESSKVQEKTLCIEGGRPTILYVLPEDSK